MMHSVSRLFSGRRGLSFTRRRRRSSGYVPLGAGRGGGRRRGRGPRFWLFLPFLLVLLVAAVFLAGRLSGCGRPGEVSGISVEFGGSGSGQAAESDNDAAAGDRGLAGETENPANTDGAAEATDPSGTDGGAEADGTSASEGSEETDGTSGAADSTGADGEAENGEPAETDGDSESAAETDGRPDRETKDAAGTDGRPDRETESTAETNGKAESAAEMGSETKSNASAGGGTGTAKSEETVAPVGTVPETKPAPVYAVSDFGPGDRVNQEALDQLGTSAFFSQKEISDSVFNRMYGKSYKEGCIIPRSELRYIRVLYYDFNGERRVGELVSSKAISQDLVDIFRELYRNHYPIEKMRLIDDYGADDDSSSSDNNTSCFNYRTVAGRNSLSLHARGLAIDINPRYNPYVRYDSEGNVTEVLPANGSSYVDREGDFSHKIDESDLCYRLFTERGFTWGGSWETEPDYMHFSRGAVPET